VSYNYFDSPNKIIFRSLFQQNRIPSDKISAPFAIFLLLDFFRASRLIHLGRTL